jgi:hypothetical protein
MLILCPRACKWSNAVFGSPSNKLTAHHMEHLEMLHVTCSQHIQLADSTWCVASLHAPHPQPPASH